MLKQFKQTMENLTGLPAYRIKEMANSAIRHAADFLRYRQFPMFREILIETCSYCNRRCEMCPVSLAPRLKESMSSEVFLKILTDLSEMRFAGEVILHLFNEPLCDDDIADKIRMASSMTPDATICINSNGDSLNNALLKELVAAGLERMLVTAYSDQAFGRLRGIFEKASDKEKRVLQIRLMTPKEFKNNRAGVLSEICEMPEALEADCYLPSNQLSINYRGDVLLCCNDYFGLSVMGNVSKGTLRSIWSSHEYIHIREVLKKRRRYDIPICRKCNFLGNRYEFAALTAPEAVAYNRRIRLGKHCSATAETAGCILLASTPQE